MAEQLDDSILVLDDRETVRQRPGTYIGDDDKIGLATIVREIIDNALDEYPNYTDKDKPIEITLHSDDSMTVRDYGRGISPYESRKQKGKIAERLAYTKLAAGGKMKANRGQNASKFSAGLNGMGAATTNFMSEYFDVTIWRDGRVFHDRFENGGIPVVELVKGKLPSKKQTGELQTGTQITFKADPTAMRTTHIDAGIVDTFLRQMRYLKAGVHLLFKNERDGDDDFTDYYSEEGLIDYIKELAVEDDVPVPLLMEPFIVHGEATDNIKGEEIDMEADIAVTFSRANSSGSMAFTNGTYNSEGGAHLRGFYSGLVKLVRHYYGEFSSEFNSKYKRQIDLINKVNKTNDVMSLLKSTDLMHIVYVVLDFKHSDPILTPQTKNKLASEEAKKAVETIFYNNAMRYLDKNISAVHELIGYLIKSLYEKAKEDDSNVKLDKREAKLAVSTKLAAARKAGPGKGAELILVEGDSAAGTLKENRDSNFQAILPLRGKVLNVQRATLSAALANNEISTMFAVLGAGFGKNYNESKLQYDRIIICTDADSDGGHITVLLLTLFLKYMRGLVENGHVYQLETPLFVNTMKGKKAKEVYTFDDAEQEKFLADNKGKIAEINRNKGLGELSKDQVIETILTPETRRLSQFTVEDDDAVDDLVETLMGKNVQGRKRLFIGGEE